MTLEDYEHRVIEIARNSLESQRSVYEVLAAHPDYRDLAMFRLRLMTDADVRTWGDLLLTGIFASESPDIRLGLFLVTLDAEQHANRIDFRCRCGCYENSRLLSKVPALREFVQDDLIGAGALTQLNDSDVVQVPGGYARLDRMLHPFVAAWALGSFPKAQVSLRLDPREGGSDRLRSSLLEYAVRPPNPTWWRTLGLQRGKTDSGCFVLDPDTVQEEFRKAAAWEFSAKGIRKLEVFVKRENQGRFSMMAEELSDRYARDGITIGRCIHLDSRSPEGTPFEKAVLDHIDLAVNVYEDGVRSIRWAQGLHEGGKVVDASFRTHMLRINDARFTTLFDLAVGFLQSATLRHEWFTAQFPPDDTHH